MLSDEQFAQLEATINILYTYGTHPNQETIINTYMADPSQIPTIQYIIENTNSSENMIHFGLTSLRSLFEIIYMEWDFDIFISYQDWCLKHLFNKAEVLNAKNVDAFCKLYGDLFTCGVRKFPDFQFYSETIQFFFDSEIIKNVEIGLNLCTNIIYSLKKLKNKLVYQQQMIKETTLLACYSIGSNIISNQQFIMEINVIKYSIELLIACISYDEDITKESTIIYFPRTPQWSNQLLNIGNLLAIVSNFCFNAEYCDELRRPSLELIHYLTSIKQDNSNLIVYIDHLIQFIIQIIQLNSLFVDTENLGIINSIILKIILSIYSKDASMIPSFEEFITSVFTYTNQYFELNFFVSNLNEFSILLNFWSNICSRFPNKAEELSVISQNLYQMLISIAGLNIDLFSQYDISYVWYISSFVYKIGLNNDKNFFKEIFSNLEHFQNELYECYAQYLSGDLESAAYLSAMELKVTFSVLIVSCPIIQKFSISDSYLIGFSMLYLINFLNESCEKVTKKHSNQGLNSFEFKWIEKVVTFVIAKIERSCQYIERSYTSFVMANSPIEMIEKVHPFLMNRLLCIAKHYPSEDPFMETVFSSILSFSSLRLTDVTIIYMSRAFLDDFLYRKMRLRPNKRMNNFQVRQWRIPARVKFHRVFATIMSVCFSCLDDVKQRGIDFTSYTSDLKERIQTMSSQHQATLYLCDLYGIFRDIQNSEAYSILNRQFFPVLTLFRKFQVQSHFVLKFFAEFTSNRSNRMNSKNGKKVKLKDLQQKSLNDLIIFKESGFYLKNFFDLFVRNPHQMTCDLKYGYRLLTNMYSNYSSIIGALKLYEKEIYNQLFTAIMNNINYILNNLSSIFDFDTISIKSGKLIISIFEFIEILGEKKTLFLDVFIVNNLFFTDILNLIKKVVVDINLKMISVDDFNLIKTILIVLFNLVNSIVNFFVENRKSEVGDTLINRQIANKESILIIMDSFFNILSKNPFFMNGIVGNLILNVFSIYPSQDLENKILDITSFLIHNVNNKEVSMILNNILEIVIPKHQEIENE